MYRYFILLSYDGTLYHGWQRQPNAVSVQEKIEDALQVPLGHKVSITGAGRTDTGVHARFMAAHFDSESQIDCQWLCFKLNCLLPQDISIYSVCPVTNDAHARFSATARTYHYYLSLTKDPFNRPFSCRFYYPLDFDIMNQAGTLLMKHTDFGSFCKTGSDNKTNICHLTQARWFQNGRQSWYFEITADRFLRNMVRAVVGTLIDVGKHKLTLEDFEQIILAGDRRASGESMPACGLFLENIEYPDSIFLTSEAPTSCLTKGTTC
ncbi:MAG TPA: tRNA pseudouridine(38-40) synthase TruA [Prevotellaceae bacterium]|nr:tRNA pseudouridine(38-40) synthase TruA [Prevotellaceae bacterium]